MAGGKADGGVMHPAGEQAAQGLSGGSKVGMAQIEQARRQLYSVDGLPEGFRELCGQAEGSVVKFMGHAFGQMPPSAHFAATQRTFAMEQRGNSIWGEVLGSVIPEASRHVLQILGLTEGGDSASQEWAVEFGHNSHELATRLMSAKFMTDSALRILTTDGEFYSLTRQLNMLASGLLQEGCGAAVSENGVTTVPVCERVAISHIPCEPWETFEERFAAEAASPSAYNFLYCSHVQFSTQRSLLGDPAEFAFRVRAAVKQGWKASGKEQETAGWDAAPDAASTTPPFLVIDGYHAFSAIPIRLPPNVPAMYLAGVLKHMGCGPNAAFVTVPRALELRPLLTGWLADPSVLDKGGFGMGDAVGFEAGLRLMGGTPAFAPALVMMCEVTKRWEQTGITVDHIHAHVLALHNALLALLPNDGPISARTLLAPQPPARRSHVLVFEQGSEEQAANTVSALAKLGIEADCRKRMVRLGFGFWHGLDDVRLLGGAVAKLGKGEQG